MDAEDAPVQPTSVAAPVQTELPNNERSDPDDHPSDDDNNAIEDEPEVDVSKLTGKQKKLFEPRLKMNEARKANQTTMVAYKKRMEAPQESRGISKQTWMEDRNKKIGKLLDYNGMDMSKAYMLDMQQMSGGKIQKVGEGTCSSGWDAITSLEEQVIALQELGFPGWSEKNVQVQQQVIEVVSHIASTATKFPMKVSCICERVADIKTCAQAMKCLTTFSEAMGIGFIFEIMSEIMKEHKNPKAFLSDVMPALLSVVEAECEKNPFEGAAAAPKKTVKACDSVSSVFGGGLDSLPREDNSGKITPELLKLLECSDWKTRSESLEAVLMFSFAPEAEGFFGDIGQEMVLKNVRDIHGLALAIVLERLNSHGAFPEVHEKTRATGTGPTVKTTSKIGKSNGYGSKSETRAVSSRGVSAKGSKAVSITSVQDISGPVGSRLAFTRTEPQWERHPMAQPSVIDPTYCNEATPSRKNSVSRLNSYPDHITPITRQIQAPFINPLFLLGYEHWLEPYFNNTEKIINTDKLTTVFSGKFIRNKKMGETAVDIVTEEQKLPLTTTDEYQWPAAWHKRVTALRLGSHGLEGSLSPHVGNLSFLHEPIWTNASRSTSAVEGDTVFDANSSSFYLGAEEASIQKKVPKVKKNWHV
ncbi:pre-mRNA-splicing factor SYF2 [Tanacetum coccineum]